MIGVEQSWKSFRWIRTELKQHPRSKRNGEENNIHDLEDTVDLLTELPFADGT